MKTYSVELYEMDALTTRNTGLTVQGNDIPTLRTQLDWVSADALVIEPGFVEGDLCVTDRDGEPLAYLALKA